MIHLVLELPTGCYSTQCQMGWEISTLCFVHPIFGCFWQQSYEIQKYYVIFVDILEGKMAKGEKTRKESHATKVTKIPKTKKYEMNET